MAFGEQGSWCSAPTYWWVSFHHLDPTFGGKNEIELMRLGICGLYVCMDWCDGELRLAVGYGQKRLRDISYGPCA